MAYLDFLTHEVAGLVRANRGWMTWNLILAVIPALLAGALFGLPQRRTWGWWAGVVVFTLFLPNAPYVVTDLIHLRGEAARSASDGVLVAGVLPLYAAFVGIGLLAYLVCTELVAREVQRGRPTTARWLVELSLHAVSALGIVLGRVARLNSWDTVTAPVGTVERVFATLTWRGAPLAFVAVFVAVALAHTVVRTLVAAAGQALAGLGRRHHVLPA